MPVALEFWMTELMSLLVIIFCNCIKLLKFFFLSKPSGADEESVSLNECLQLSFHRSCRHHILLLYTREILILDLQINQTVGIIAIDRASSPFTQVSSNCKLRYL